ncbi:hypothetical protein BDP27DRAFT_1320691 [Rhodocollybia butyracea]|uniref:Uncharacterized protein n=1 Tax=Rhodocollybia butyracea TaxID=206335 RepID=A0A9P5PZW0_9AGAR|nr:hypothetical protein BDP27DRAFT_1320691 [Rhodocollybia butyracea]
MVIFCLYYCSVAKAVCFSFSSQLCLIFFPFIVITLYIFHHRSRFALIFAFYLLSSFRLQFGLCISSLL